MTADPTYVPQSTTSDAQLSPSEPLFEADVEPAVTESEVVNEGVGAEGLALDNGGVVEEAIEEAREPQASDAVQRSVPETRPDAKGDGDADAAQGESAEPKSERDAKEKGVLIPEPPKGFRQLDAGGGTPVESDGIADPPKPPTKEVHLWQLPIEFDRYGSAVRPRDVRNVDYDVRFGTRLKRRNDDRSVNR